MIGTATRFSFTRISGELDGSTDTCAADYLSPVTADLDATSSTSWAGLCLVIMLMALPFAFVAWLFR